MLVLIIPTWQNLGDLRIVFFFGRIIRLNKHMQELKGKKRCSLYICMLLKYKFIQAIYSSQCLNRGCYEMLCKCINNLIKLLVVVGSLSIES